MSDTPLGFGKLPKVESVTAIVEIQGKNNKTKIGDINNVLSSKR